jgi:hypothetical protein
MISNKYITIEEICKLVEYHIPANKVEASMSHEDNTMNFRVFFKSTDLVIKLTDMELDKAQSVDELLETMRTKLREELLNPKYWRVNAEDILWMVRRFQSTTGIDPDYEIKDRLRYSTVKDRVQTNKRKGPMYEDIEPVVKDSRSPNMGWNPDIGYNERMEDFERGRDGFSYNDPRYV